MNNIKMHQSPVVIYCICQIRELYREQTRTQYFQEEKLSCLLTIFLSVLSLLYTALHM